MEATRNVGQKPALELTKAMVQNRSGDEMKEALDVKITPIKTEGASQSTCHNPCNAV